MPKYYIKIAYHYGIVAGRTPTHDYVRDTKDQVNTLIQDLLKQPEIHVEHVQIILGEEIEVKWKNEQKTVIQNEKTLIGIE